MKKIPIIIVSSLLTVGCALANSGPPRCSDTEVSQRAWELVYEPFYEELEIINFWGDLDSFEWFELQSIRDRGVTEGNIRLCAADFSFNTATRKTFNGKVTERPSQNITIPIEFSVESLEDGGFYVTILND